MGFSPSLSWVLPAEMPTRRGRPFASDRMCILEPGLPRSTGLGPVCSPLFSPDVGGVEDDAGDVDEAGVVEPVQHCFMQATPDTGPGPDQEPAVRGRLRYAEARRKLTPGASADQDVNDRREQRFIRRVLRSAALRPNPRRRDQRLGALPQPVRHDPAPCSPPHTGSTSASPRRTRSYSPSQLAIRGWERCWPGWCSNG